MVEAIGLQIGGQFFRRFEVLAVLTVVEHVTGHLYRFIESLISPTVRCRQMTQVTESVTEVLAVLVVEVLLQGGDLLLIEVVILHKVAGA